MIKRIASRLRGLQLIKTLCLLCLSSTSFQLPFGLVFQRIVNKVFHLGEGCPSPLNQKSDMEKAIDYNATIFIEYEDGSGFNFDVSISGTENEIVAELMMITRGTLMSSNADKATCYKPDGFELCSYVK